MSTKTTILREHLAATAKEQLSLNNFRFGAIEIKILESSQPGESDQIRVSIYDRFEDVEVLFYVPIDRMEIIKDALSDMPKENLLDTIMQKLGASTLADFGNGKVVAALESRHVEEVLTSFFPSPAQPMLYRGYEIFRDADFFDTIAYRIAGRESANHVDTIEEAKKIIDYLWHTAEFHHTSPARSGPPPPKGGEP